MLLNRFILGRSYRHNSSGYGELLRRLMQCLDEPFHQRKGNGDSEPLTPAVVVVLRHHQVRTLAIDALMAVNGELLARAVHPYRLAYIFHAVEF